MKSLEGYERKFSWTSKAYYKSFALGKDEIDEVIFGLYSNGGGGTPGEMLMIWKDLCGEVVPRLHVYDDAWQVMSSFGAIWNELSKYDGKNIPPEKFVEILQSLGFKDQTAYEEE